MKYILLCFIVLNMIACNSQKDSYTQEQLYERMSSGVMLVKNTYNYSVFNNKYGTLYILTTGGEYICHKYESSTYDSIMRNYNKTIYGTGFFLNNKETIITNSHVINPPIDTIKLYNSIKTYLINKIEEHINLLEKNIEFKSYCIRKLSNNQNLSNLEREFFNNSEEYIKLQRDASARLLKELHDEDFEENYTIGINEQKIGVALNGNKISSDKDFAEALIVKDIPNYDLGVIRLNLIVQWNLERKGNFKNRYVFKLPDERKNSKNNDELKLYMIGFNRGPNLATTNEGLKAQITQGNISQNTDNIKIMYSIPALPGSSGSPVVNQYGELVAVNFAGISTTQGFNYGIKAEHLKEILDKQ